MISFQSFLGTFQTLILSAGKMMFICSRFICSYVWLNGYWFFRLYYKCGYSDDHKCPAKKYVQQQSNSSPTPVFMVTLINEHTCETLFPDEASSSSTSAASHVLDFTKASLSPPMMAAAPGLKKKEEEDSMSAVSMHSYPYDEYLSSSLPTISPDGDQVKFSPGPGW
jgi:hypothetical protein